MKIKLRPIISAKLFYCLLFCMLFSLHEQPVIAQLAIPRIVGSPYPASNPPDRLYSVSDNIPYSEKIIFQTLQGLLARIKPEIIRDVSGHVQIAQNAGVSIDNTYHDNFPGLLAHYTSRLSGYILCNKQDHSTNVAISLASVLNAVAVPADIEQEAINAGLKKLIDVRGKDENWLLDNYGNSFSKNIVSYQAGVDARGACVADYSVFTGALQFWDSDPNGTLANRVYNRMNDGGTFMGWGPSEYDVVSNLSKHNLSIHASDWASNMSTLTNIPAEIPKQKDPITPYKVVPNVHTVCFVMSDGDNVQWLLGAHNDKSMWANPDRADINLGWTMSPALAEVAPAVYKKYADNCLTTPSGRNLLVASPSGRGYYFPGLYPDLAKETNLLNKYMEKTDMRIVNIIDIDNGPHTPDQYLRQSNIDALFYYSYGSQYTGLKGQISWYKDKPSIGGRFKLWGKTGDRSVNDQVCTDLANTLNAQSTNINSVDGYSLIPVHVWTMNVSDVKNCISKLGPNVRVVAPDEFVWLIKRNLKGIQVGNGNGLLAEYFKGYNMDALQYTETDEDINYDWGTGSPNQSKLGVDQFSVRWSGQIQPLYSEQYTFYVNSDDGVRLTINGQLLIDNYSVQGAYTRKAVISLTAGKKYDIKLEYAEGGGNAFCKLEWESPSQSRQIVPKDQLYSRFPSTGVITAYDDCNYGGFGGGLEVGNYTLSDLNFKGILNDQLSSIKVAEGFKAILYQDDNFGGQSITITSSNPCFDNTWNNKVSSIKVLTNGVTNMEGTYFLENRNSGLIMDVSGGPINMNDGSVIQQWNLALTTNQQFKFTHLGNGTYEIQAVHSLKSLDVNDMSMDNGAGLTQRTYNGTLNQQFVVVKTSEGYYKIIVKENGKVLEIRNASTAPEGVVQQYDNNNQICGQWSFITLQPTDPVIAYRDCNYGGLPVSLPVGNYTLAQLQALGMDENDISSLKMVEGFKAVLFDGDTFTGDSVEVTANNSCLSILNDKATSLKIKTNGVTNLSGIYFLQNRKSGLYMDVRGGTGALNDGARIQQWYANGGQDNQRFEFVHLGDGTYKIIAQQSKKSLDVNAISMDDKAIVQQWTYFGTFNQQFVVVSTGDGYYKLIPKHSGKLVEVENGSTAAEAFVQQFTNNNQLCGQWKLIQPVNGTGDGLTANYFNGMDFQTLRYSRKDTVINFNWGTGSPDASVSSDKFSARWTGKIQPRYTGTYTFYLNTDNGRRLWINNQLVIDKWIDDWGTEYSGTIDLVAGQKYDIKLEYFEDFGGANCKLEWSSGLQIREVVAKSQLYSNVLPNVNITGPTSTTLFTAPASVNITTASSDSDGSVSKVEFYQGTVKIGESASSPFSYNWINVGKGTYILTARVTDNQGACANSSPITITVNQGTANGDGLTGNYFNGMNFETPIYSRKDATINFSWGTGSPDPSVNSDKFSVRWTGQIQPRYSETYTFYVNSDNGRRLWINNQLIIDKWIDDWGTEYSGTITLTAGQLYDIKLEYFEDWGGASCKLAWSSASQTREVVPQSQLYSNSLPTVSVASPANNASYNAPATINLASSASDVDGSVSKVDYYNGSTLIASTTSSYNYSWNNVAAGSYNITVIATDNRGGVTVSTPVSVTVKSATNQAPTVNITSPTNNSSYNAPASITFSANASDADGTISKVEYFNGSQSIGSSASSLYNITWSNVAAGTYTITAKATDNTNATTVSSAITLTVNSVSTNTCSGIPQYVENGGYVDGSKVQNGGSSYQCKPYPYSGWCNGAAWAYAPGTGSYWTDAWTLLGSCSGAVAPTMAAPAPVVSPNPATDLISLNIDQTVKVTVYNSMGNVSIPETEVVANGSLSISSLAAGVYSIKIETGSNVIMKSFVKN